MARICKIDGCYTPTPHKTDSLCADHYRAKLKKQRENADRAARLGQCTGEGCNRLVGEDQKRRGILFCHACENRDLADRAMAPLIAKAEEEYRARQERREKELELLRDRKYRELDDARDVADLRDWIRKYVLEADEKEHGS